MSQHQYRGRGFVPHPAPHHDYVVLAKLLTGLLLFVCLCVVLCCVVCVSGCGVCDDRVLLGSSQEDHHSLLSALRAASEAKTPLCKVLDERKLTEQYR